MFGVKMKVIVLFVHLLCAPVSSSFYDELQGAMHSVQHGFGKLLSDVVVDVTDTVHCTISAVEHVLTLNGLMRTKSPFGHKCRNGPLPPIENSNDPLANFLKTRDAIEGQTFRETTSKELMNSISKVNRTLNHALDNNQNQNKINSLSKVLKDETEQLTKVSNILRQELNSISKNVNNELEKFEKDLGPSVWSEIEKDRKDPTYLSRPDVNGLSGGGDKAQGEVTNLQKENNVQKSIDDVKQEFEHLRDNIQPPERDNFPKNFRDVTNNIRNKNHNTNLNKEKRMPTGPVFGIGNENLDQFSPFYDPNAGNEAGHKHVVDETLSIIKDSKRNEEIMNKLFSQANAAPDVFSNPKMFNF